MNRYGYHAMAGPTLCGQGHKEVSGRLLNIGLLYVLTHTARYQTDDLRRVDDVIVVRCNRNIETTMIRVVMHAVFSFR